MFATKNSLRLVLALILGFFFIFPSSILSYSYATNISLKNLWLNQLKEKSIPKNKVSYCYINEDGNIEGNQENLLLPLASVSKIFTSLWALNKLGDENYQFHTTFFYSKKLNRIHIQGDGDPLMGERKIWWIITNLNKLGIQHVSKITFDEKFLFFPSIFENHHYEHSRISNGIKYFGPYVSSLTAVKNNLMTYFNTQLLSTSQKKLLVVHAKNFPSAIKTNLNFSVDAISYSKENPISEDDTIPIQFPSAPLKDLLKFINTYSNNPASDLLFNFLGGATGLIQFLQDSKIIEDQNEANFFTGSGIPLTITKDNTSRRNVNKTSCKTVLKVITQLSLLAQGQNADQFDDFLIPDKNSFSPLFDWLPVAGLEGTLKKNISWSRSVIGKTGSLRDGRMLAGTISSQTGERLFTFLSQVSSSKISSIVEIYQTMMKNFFTEFGKKDPFEYDSTFESSKFLGGIQKDIIIKNTLVNQNVLY